MTNVQAVSFGNHEKRKGPTIGGTIGMGALGALGGGAVYATKNHKEIGDYIKSKYVKPKEGEEVMAQLKGAWVNLKEALNGHMKNMGKFVGIGAAIGAGTYIVIKTISGALNKDS